MTNTSATGGYLSPEAGGPGYGLALNRFLNAYIAGLTGIAGELVRQGYQAEPPNLPADVLVWCGYSVTTLPSDQYAVEQHDDEKDVLLRNEQIGVLSSFYGVGTEREAFGAAARMRDGLAISQNREILTRLDMGLTEVSEIIQVPMLIKERWLDRYDFRFVLGRQIRREYPVLSLLSAVGNIVTSDGDVISINVTNPS